MIGDHDEHGDVNLSTSRRVGAEQRDCGGAGTVRLVAGGAISQDATSGAITASMLSVKDSGGQVVLEAPNAVGTVAASLTNPTSAFSFNDTARVTDRRLGVGAAAGGRGPVIAVPAR